MVQLPKDAFRRFDESSDEIFYQIPRLVTHIDDTAIAAVTQLYRQYFPANGTILDLMSSWISHLPPEIPYRRVVGVGMNRIELEANHRLDDYITQDLNRTPGLPFGDAEFNGAAICVSVQYLTQPVEVLRDVGRVLHPGAPLVITFSNRCFPSKAVAIWQRLDDGGHSRLVTQYFNQAGNWEGVTQLDCSHHPSQGFDPLYAVVGRSRGPYIQP
ncbi:MAG: methyltransferase type 11 [Chloroflexi bacterium]|nr:methyltransferase type 11 [Chloroflexota bacterium]